MNGPAEQLSARFVNVHSILSFKAFGGKASFPPEGVGECALTTGEIKRMRWFRDSLSDDGRVSQKKICFAVQCGKPRYNAGLVRERGGRRRNRGAKGRFEVARLHMETRGLGRDQNVD